MTAKPLRNRLGARILAWPIRFPRVALLLAAAIVAMSALVVQRLQPSGSIDDLIARDNPAAVAFGRVMNDFAIADDMILVATDVRHNLDPLPSRAELSGFAERFASIVKEHHGEMVERVSHGSVGDASLQEFIERHIIPTGLLYLDNDQLNDLQDRLTPQHMARQMRRNEDLVQAPGPAAAAIAEKLLADPLRLRDFMLDAFAAAGPAGVATSDRNGYSTDGRSILIRIKGRRPSTDLDFTRSFVASMKQAATCANSTGLHLEWTGAYAIAAASEHAIRSDMQSSVVTAVVLMQLLFLAMYRRLVSFPLAFGPTAVAIGAAFAMFTLLSGSLTPATAVVGAVLAGLGDDFSMHFMSHYDQRRQRGLSASSAAVHTSVELAAPMAAAMLTSLVGLLVISRSSVPALRDFAWLSGMGLAGSMLAALSILPALLVMLEGGRRGQPRTWMQPGHRMRLDRAILALDDHRRGATVFTAAIWLAAAATLVFALVTERCIVPFETDLRVMHPRSSNALEVQESLGERFGAPGSTMLLHVTGNSFEQLVAKSHQVQRALRSPGAGQAGVVSSLSLATVLPDPAQLEARGRDIERIVLDQVMRDFDAAIEESIFEPSAFEAARAFLKRLLQPSDAPSITDLLEDRGLAALFLPNSALSGFEPIQAMGFVLLSHPLRNLDERDAAIHAIREAIAEVPGVTLTGLAVLAHDTQSSLRRELATLAGAAGASVFVVIVLFLRRMTDVALTLVPLAFGVTVVLAWMQVSGEGINPINLVGVPLLIGAGEDYGLYVISMARQSRLAGESSAALRARLAASLHALTGTWLTTLIGFGSLMFTSTPAIQSLGRMTAIGMAACFLATVLGVVPILLMRHRRGGTIA